jgi:hypothetical protein
MACSRGFGIVHRLYCAFCSLSSMSNLYSAPEYLLTTDGVSQSGKSRRETTWSLLVRTRKAATSVSRGCQYVTCQMARIYSASPAANRESLGVSTMDSTRRCLDGNGNVCTWVSTRLLGRSLARPGHIYICPPTPPLERPASQLGSRRARRPPCHPSAVMHKKKSRGRRVPKSQRYPNAWRFVSS